MGIVELRDYNLKQTTLVTDTTMNGLNRLELKQLRVLVSRGGEDGADPTGDK